MGPWDKICTNYFNVESPQVWYGPAGMNKSTSLPLIENRPPAVSRLHMAQSNIHVICSSVWQDVEPRTPFYRSFLFFLLGAFPRLVICMHLRPIMQKRRLQISDNMYLEMAQPQIWPLPEWTAVFINASWVSEEDNLLRSSSYHLWAHDTQSFPTSKGIRCHCAFLKYARSAAVNGPVCLHRFANGTMESWVE